MIARNVIDDWFADHFARGIELRWRFIFADSRRPALQAFAGVLAQGRYSVVGIFGPTESGGPRFLHVERVERHDEASLYDRCQELSALAANHRIARFAGFEVVNLDGSPLV